MTRDELITLVLNRCGRRAADSAMTGYAQDEILRIQNRFERGLQHPQTGGIFFPAFLLSELETSSTVDGEERIELPSRFLQEYEQGALWIKEDSDSDWKALHKDEYDVLVKEYPGEGLPKAYALTSPYWRLFPTPNASYSLRTLVYKGEPVLDTDIENVWTKEAAELTIAELGRIIAAFYLYNGEVASAFAADRDAELLRLCNEAVAGEVANMDLRMGGV